MTELYSGTVSWVSHDVRQIMNVKGNFLRLLYLIIKCATLAKLRRRHFKTLDLSMISFHAAHDREHDGD